MRFSLPEKFEQRTRWAYLQGGIEIGPYSAGEILALLEKREISPDTMIVELNSRRTCPVREVGPFARFVITIVTADRQRKAEQEFEDTRDGVIRAARMKIALFVVLGLVLLAGLILMMIFVNPFKPDAPKTIEEPRPSAAEQTGEASKKKDEKEPEFKIHESEPEEMEEGEEDQMMRSVRESQMLALTDETLANGAKLEGPGKAIPDPAVRGNGPGGQAGAGAAGAGGPLEAGKGGEAISTFDFTGDEIDVEESSEDLARDRLAAVVRECTLKMMHKFQDVAKMEIRAAVKLQPDGRMTGLKLNVTPKKHVGDLKMCISAELMRRRVPASSSDQTKTVITTVSVSAVE